MNAVSEGGRSGCKILDPDVDAPERGIRWMTYEPMIMRHNCGRRPEGFSMARSGGAAVGATLAEMAALEAASVSAFHRLARELAHHGAPGHLVERARRAMRDEVRHARTLRRLARARGGQPVKWRRDKLPIRPLFEIALENAVEGCVHEAFGAATAMVQGTRAEDAELRDAFGRIGDEECEHAALAWEVHEWLMANLPPEQRGCVARAQQQAFDAVEYGLGAEPANAQTRRMIGLPDPPMALALFTRMREQLQQPCLG